MDNTKNFISIYTLDLYSPKEIIEGAEKADAIYFSLDIQYNNAAYNALINRNTV